MLFKYRYQILIIIVAVVYFIGKFFYSEKKLNHIIPETKKEIFQW